MSLAVPNFPQPSSSVGFSLKNVLIPTLLAAALVGGGYYAYQSYTIAEADKNKPNATKLISDISSRLATSVKLADKFKDADGDLVADPPAETVKPAKLIFSAVASDKAEDEKKRWEKFADYLSKATGIPVEYNLEAKTLDEQVKALADGKLHVTAFNTGQVMSAVNTAGFVPCCVPATEEGKYGYKVEFYTLATSPLTDLKSAKGHILILTAMGSNSGFKVPVALFQEKLNLLPGRDYDFALAGTYPKAIIDSSKVDKEGKAKLFALPSDFADTAFELAKKDVENLKEKDKKADPNSVEKSKFRKIDETTEVFPPLCFGYAHNLDKDLAEKIQKAFVECKFADTGLDAVYKRAGSKKFVAIKYKDVWEPVRKVDQKLMSLGK
jgi:phosphonate transport system substrate-binding protein